LEGTALEQDKSGILLSVNGLEIFYRAQDILSITELQADETFGAERLNEARRRAALGYEERAIVMAKDVLSYSLSLELDGQAEALIAELYFKHGDPEEFLAFADLALRDGARVELELASKPFPGWLGRPLGLLRNIGLTNLPRQGSTVKLRLSSTALEIIPKDGCCIQRIPIGSAVSATAGKTGKGEMALDLRSLPDAGHASADIRLYPASASMERTGPSSVLDWLLPDSVFLSPQKDDKPMAALAAVIQATADRRAEHETLRRLLAARAKDSSPASSSTQPARQPDHETMPGIREMLEQAKAK
jgi:hypothetical protein